eukprot:CAMPEP_0198220232 /NCGR_PEP_ID=MMETSP1445-20131203/78225_1 /TAXON_ID=36898 /ORGANISM="Pyramimonas sp., Strain CCMP2087" /LENGTH=131 /DNA_ID=CAMNT_0043897949 /DNA_START=44 /DNA_END=436 /DNA_ORIENTATION=-
MMLFSKEMSRASSLTRALARGHMGPNVSLARAVAAGLPVHPVTNLSSTQLQQSGAGNWRGFHQSALLGDSSSQPPRASNKTAEKESAARDAQVCPDCARRGILTKMTPVYDTGVSILSTVVCPPGRKADPQ